MLYIYNFPITFTIVIFTLFAIIVLYYILPFVIYIISEFWKSNKSIIVELSCVH